MTNEQVHVINTQPRIFHLPPEVRAEIVKLGDGNTQVHHRVIGQGAQIVPSAPRDKDGRPQATAVPAAQWERISKHPQVRAWLMKGWLKLAEGGLEENGVEHRSESLSQYGAATALVIVQGEENKKLLAEWLKTEGREDVKNALKARLAELAAKK